MATFGYVEIPADVVCLKSSLKDAEIHGARPASRIMTSLPHPELQAPSSDTLPGSTSNITSPTKSAFTMLPQLLISSSLQIPSSTPLSTPHNPRGQPQLLSTRDPLSIPITTVNFKRFVSKSGPIFWVQDRVEEIVMWRKGWQITGVWMAAYAFLCYFPRLVLLVPHAILLGILLATYPSEQLSSTNDRGATPTPPSNAGEGTVDWQANIQAIQNLMGAVADLHDLILPFVPHLTHATPYTPLILTFLLATFLFAIPLLPLIPLRPTFLVLGLGPFIFTHPFMMYRVLPLIVSLLHDKSHRARVLRIIDDDRLEDRHWRSELKEVELFENERWNASSDGEAVSGSWGKSYLKSSERSAWTRAQDGWSGVKEDGSGEVSNLTFSLAPGWAFIETEDWRVDLEATWVANVGPDDGGWVYTNDSWLNPSAVPLDTWKSVGMTRRRRWTRRIYYDPAIAT